MAKAIRFVSEPESNRLVISIEGVNVNEIDILSKLITTLADANTSVESKTSNSLQPNKEVTKPEDIKPKNVPIPFVDFDNKDKAKKYAKEHNFNITWDSKGKTWSCPAERLEELKEFFHIS